MSLECCCGVLVVAGIATLLGLLRLRWHYRQAMRDVWGQQKTPPERGLWG